MRLEVSFRRVEDTGATLGWAWTKIVIADRRAGSAGGSELGLSGGELQALALGAGFCNQLYFGTTALLHLNAELLNAIKVERITPEPEQAKATEHGIEYAIAVAGPGQRTSVRILFTWEQVGIVNGEVGLAARPAARFRQFVYP